ncbi:FAD-dependent oxidoreductase [Priestia endophytica]|uniref:FAD-dependent oxidoreductase n=1 Tax=Priestia endophytica TaxID=135735 RepID=UPI000DCA73DE|nr:FAD-dependent oxidoreductase [Priestia endophytica]RAS84880.1 hypothetical protein A4U60_10435 [Priestia endophytica]
MENAIIIGGGIGGLTTGALLSKHGYKVIVLEADGEVGGCAGKFSKDLFSFPVGATFRMGFEEEGIHNKILRYLGINVNIFPLSEAIRITGFSAPLSVFQNRTNHLKQLVQVFPHYKENLSSFYEELWKIARKVRRLIGRVPVMPPKTPQEWRYLFSSLGLSDVSLLSSFIYENGC